MITEEEYNKACKIIDQYHMERQREAELDMDDDDYNDDEDEELEREMEEYSTALNCTCGAGRYIKEGRTTLLIVFVVLNDMRVMCSAIGDARPELEPRGSERRVVVQWTSPFLDGETVHDPH